ncbi:RNA-binding protein [Candidatus Woesearchaeota archaeon]|nr:RNA-binding protein [Candidatus Woesearchaeota archaeon]
MSELKVEERSIVVPGEILADGMEYLPTKGTYRDGNYIRASRLGLVSVDGKVLKLIPLTGKYFPKRGDVIIGKVIDIMLAGWRIDFNSAYSAMISLKDATTEFIERGADLTRYFNLGDYVIGKITNVTSQNLVDVTTKGPGFRKLVGGRVIEVESSKVPRIVGKQGSMISMIQTLTGCQILVGQNGWVWLQGEPRHEIIAIRTIKKVEQESHLSGLTDAVKAFIDEELKKVQ